MISILRHIRIKEHPASKAKISQYFKWHQTKLHPISAGSSNVSALKVANRHNNRKETCRSYLHVWQLTGNVFPLVDCAHLLWAHLHHSLLHKSANIPVVCIYHHSSYIFKWVCRNTQHWLCVCMITFTAVTESVILEKRYVMSIIVGMWVQQYFNSNFNRPICSIHQTSLRIWHLQLSVVCVALISN